MTVAQNSDKTIEGPAGEAGPSGDLRAEGDRPRICPEETKGGPSRLRLLGTMFAHS